jgi:hypothetical protein
MSLVLWRVMLAMPMWSDVRGEEDRRPVHEGPGRPSGGRPRFPVRAVLRHARALSDERSHHLPAPSESDDMGVDRAAPVMGEESDFRALGSTGSDSGIVFGSRVLAPAELDRARAVAAECGLTLADPLPFALALREAAGSGSLSDVTIEARRRALRTLLARRVREYCARTGASHRDTYARLKRKAGRAVGRLNELALVRHVRTVEGWLAQASRPAAAAAAAPTARV